MTLIFARKIRKWVLGVASLTILCLTVLGIMNIIEERYSRVDRSNAMQVAKTVTQEQVIPVASPDFFTEYRLERDKIRSEQSDLLREAVKNAKSEDARQRVQDTVLKLVLEKQREMEIENMIKGRGFGDAIVFLRDNSVSAIVKTNSLSREEVIQVADIISRISGVKAEDITISAKP